MFFGCIRAGCVLVPINWRFANPEVEYLLRDSGASVLVHAPRFADASARAAAALDAPPLLMPTTGRAGEDLRSILDAPAVRDVADRGHVGGALRPMFGP